MKKIHRAKIGPGDICFLKILPKDVCVSLSQDVEDDKVIENNNDYDDDDDDGEEEEGGVNRMSPHLWSKSALCSSWVRPPSLPPHLVREVIKKKNWDESVRLTD